jgi:hypothetical protein
MSSPRPVRPARKRGADTSHARAGPEPAPSSIVPEAVPENGGQALPTEPRAPGRTGPPGTHIRRATRRRLLLASGTLATVIPGGPGIAWAIAGRPSAVPFLATAALVALITVILNGVAAMYEARQETRRKEIERHSADTLAAAFARCIDDSHARAQGLTGLQDAKEAERVRDSARRLTVDMTAAIAALVELPMTAPHRHAPKDDAKEADHLADFGGG